MDKTTIKEMLGWGFGLWLIGYILGFALFMMVPQSMIGWILMPIGTLITLWVLFKKIGDGPIRYYLSLGLAWTVIAVVCDYLFLVSLLKPSDGYYKPDVYLYYALTLLLPIFAGWYKNRARGNQG